MIADSMARWCFHSTNITGTWSLQVYGLGFSSVLEDHRPAGLLPGWQLLTLGENYRSLVDFKSFTASKIIYLYFQDSKHASVITGVRTLRSSDLDQLHVPRVITSIGPRAFLVAAPSEWTPFRNLLSENKLLSVRNWKRIVWSGFSDLNLR